MRTIRDGLVLLVCVGLVGACAQGGTDNSQSNTAPESILELVTERLDPGQFPWDAEEFKETFVEEGAVRYQAAGSSSCSPQLVGAYLVEGTVVLERVDWFAVVNEDQWSLLPTDYACTLDLRRYSFKVTHPSGEPFEHDQPIVVREVSLVFDN